MLLGRFDLVGVAFERIEFIFVMESHVIAGKHDFKIVRVVVKPVIILVVYMLICVQFASEKYLHHNAVFPSPATIVAFNLPIESAKFGRIALFSRAWRQPSVVVSSSSANNHAGFEGWIAPVGKAGTTFGAVHPLFVSANQSYRERFVAGAATPENNAALSACEVLHISILHKRG